jgi:hypothetical protein
MNYENSQLIVYNGNNVHFINGIEIIEHFNCELVDSNSEFLKYSINEDVYIDSLTKNNNLEFSKIINIYIKQTPGVIYDLFLNNATYYISNVLCFNLKQKKSYFVKNLENIEKKFLLQNIDKFNSDVIDSLENIKLNLTNGFLVGYWLLRGGFQQIKKNDIEHPSWSGNPENIDLFKILLKNETYLIKDFKNNLESIVLINEEFTDFFKFYFKQSRNKTFPLWIYSAPLEFIQGLLYGLIAANSYISVDSKNNHYLTIKIINSNLIYNINQLLEFRLNIYSKVIGKNNYLSLKINNKLYELLKFGIDEKFIKVNEFNDIDPILSKEIKYDKYKILPWYKCKINKKEVDNLFSLELENNNIHMISNGLFVAS